jgi:hypothetical protein
MKYRNVMAGRDELIHHFGTEEAGASPMTRAPRPMRGIKMVLVLVSKST